MRVGCLQFDPQRGDVEGNMTRADKILDQIGQKWSITKEAELDFLILPKMAFSGSGFGPGEIKEFLEPAGGCNTRLWAQTAAMKYECDVVAGYPQEVDSYSAKHTSEEFFSSAILINHHGQSVANSPERTLNREFPILSDIETEVGKVSIGQYTDLGDDESSNARESEAFADHILAQGVNIVIFPLAWKTRLEPHEISDEPDLPDNDALTRWLARLWPLVEAKLEKEIFFVLCNRVGREGDAIYAGTSAVISIMDGEIFVYELMKSSEEGLLLVDTSEGPRYKLVQSEGDSEQKHDSDSVDSIDSPQAEPFTPDTSYRGSDTFQEFPQEPAIIDERIPSKQPALAVAAEYPPARTLGQSMRTKGQDRPKLNIPKSTSRPPQEIPLAEYRARAARGSKFKATVGKVRSPEASTPHPNGARRRPQLHRTSREYASRKLNLPSTSRNTALFEDPKTTISSSPQRWSGHWLAVAPDGSTKSQDLCSGPKEMKQAQAALPIRRNEPRAARSRFTCPPCHLAVPDLDNPPRDSPAIKRPVSPKSRNVRILETLKASISQEDCGIIPILASPSIITTSSQAGSDSSEPRGRRQKPRKLSEEDTQSSSRNSTRNGLLHSRVRYNDGGGDARKTAQRSRSMTTAQHRDPHRSASLPAVQNKRGMDLRVVQPSKMLRSGSRPRQSVRKELW